MTHYIAVHTEGECLISCDHKHKTVTAAVPCLAAAGAYVVAVKRSKSRPLNPKEEAEFCEARAWQMRKDRKRRLSFKSLRKRFGGDRR